MSDGPATRNPDGLTIGVREAERLARDAVLIAQGVAAGTLKDVTDLPDNEFIARLKRR